MGIAIIFIILLHYPKVKYLGLMENLRVRRAGFAYRRPYEGFLNRYKSLCPETWPHPKGDNKSAVQTLVNHLKVKTIPSNCTLISR
jgi:myosin-1